MTKFITYYNLCPIHDPDEFLGISSDREEGKIIATLGKNIIVVIQISNQEQIKSWSTLEKLSSKVVYDQKSQKYVGVFAHRSLRCWDESTIDINKCKKLKFHKNIADLICYDDTTLVIFVDGTCEELATAIQSRKDHDQENVESQLSVGSNVSILNAKISSLSDGRKCLTFFEKHQNDDNITLVKINLEYETSSKSFNNIQKFVLKRENLNVNVAGYAVIEGEEAPVLLTIWSDKRLFLLTLNDYVTPEKCPGNFVSMLNALKVDTPLSIIGVSKHFIAIYGAHSSQEGASLILYNTQFKVIKAKQFFKIYFNFSRLWAVDEHILLAMGQNLSVVSYRISKELLSEFIGTQSSNDFETAVENDNINEEDPIQESILLKETPVIKAASCFSTEIIETDINFADGKTIPFESVSSFDRELNSLNNYSMHVDIVQVENAHEDYQINLMNNMLDDGFSTKEVKLIAEQLEKCGASEHEITEKLLLVLIQSNLIQDIAVCLRRYSNVSEKILAKTLKYITSNILTAMDTLTTECPNQDVEPMDIVTERADVPLHDEAEELPNANILLNKYQNVPQIKTYMDVLNVVLSCSFDSEIITTHIRRELDYAHVAFLLEYLYNIVNSEHNFHLEMNRFGTDFIDTELHIFRWFGTFLNTHFQKLALSKDVHLIEVLFKWSELFTLYKKEISELRRVSSMLYSIVQRKKIFKEKNYSKWYSIEEVTLY